MKVDISFIPKSYLNHSLLSLLNKEITYPYKRLDDLKNDKKALRTFFEQRSNYLSLVHQLSKLEEELLLNQEDSLAQKCREFINSLEKHSRVMN